MLLQQHILRERTLEYATPVTLADLPCRAARQELLRPVFLVQHLLRANLEHLHEGPVNFSQFAITQQNKKLKS